jgi:hypothetical protein
MRKSLFVAGALLVVLAATVDLGRIPSFWWDEGWTLWVARNWVELGHYGRLLAGQPMPAGLSAGFPVIAPIALSFKLFGVGVWQGRLPGVLFLLGALALVCYLAGRIYPRKVAVLALVLLLAMPLNEKLHPVLTGRQVLGEMPMLLFLLAGYALFYKSLEGKAWWILPAALLWGIALKTKAQTPPFWLASLALPFAVCLLKGWRRPVLLTGAGVLLAGIVSQALIPWLQALATRGSPPPGAPLSGYYGMSAIVPVLHVRLQAWISAFAFGLPTLVGLVYAGWKSLKGLRAANLDTNREVLRLALWAFTGSWMAWYLLLAMYWPRYLFPALFIGSLFAAGLLYDLTGQFDLRLTVRRVGSLFRLRRVDRLSLGALLAVVLIAQTAAVTGLVSALSTPYLKDSSAEQAAGYIRSQIPETALIESYETPVFFLADRRYHYPPDQVHVQLNRRTLIDAGTPVIYDPLAADPDYLVVGPSGAEWHLYDDLLAEGLFSLVYSNSRYQIYERVRP